MNLQQQINAMVRLAILRILLEDNGHSQNHEIMTSAIDTATAQSLTYEQMKKHFAWLEDQKLISTEFVGRFVMAELTRKGINVAQGKEVVPGVDKLGPEDR